MLNNYAEKIKFFKHIVNDIQLGVKNYHLMNIINSNEYNICLDGLDKIINLINSISNENIINDLQYINNNLSSLIKNYGIYNFEYLLKVCLEHDFIVNNINNSDHKDKYDIIKTYCHPINYKILNWNEKTNKIKKRIDSVSKNKIICE